VRAYDKVSLEQEIESGDMAGDRLRRLAGKAKKNVERYRKERQSRDINIDSTNGAHDNSENRLARLDRQPTPEDR